MTILSQDRIEKILRRCAAYIPINRIINSKFINKNLGVFSCYKNMLLCLLKSAFENKHSDASLYDHFDPQTRFWQKIDEETRTL